MSSCRKLIGAMFIAAVPLLFAACSSSDKVQTHQVGDYFLTVSTDPGTLRVGSDAEITVHIEKDDESMENCHPYFRQYMPAHQMATDHTLHSMEALEKGLYRGRGGEFGMGGNWELEFQFNCGDGMKTIVFPYELNWM